MTTITEGKMIFTFPDTFQVNKYDESHFFRNQVDKCQGTKGVDILALSENRLFLIEIKDFRGYRIENKQRLKSGELVIEVTQKVRDTLMLGLKEAGELPNASTLCGRCEAVCPMQIPLPQLLRAHRVKEHQAKSSSGRFALKLWIFFANTPLSPFDCPEDPIFSEIGLPPVFTFCGWLDRKP